MLDVFSISNSFKVVSFHGSDIPHFTPSDREYWLKIVDDLGAKSAKAQHLARPITTSEKLLRTAQHHRVYIALEGCQFKPIGFGKVGKKRIFHLSEDNDNVEHLTCQCLLDFYIKEDVQRHGYGRLLMDAMLKIDPHLHDLNDLGIDRPSEACLSFFEKNYSLAPFRVGIDHNFCVFSDEALSTSPYQTSSQGHIATASKATSIYYDKN
ncbi:unnamed protein product [Umbelopsis ramanniana]